MYSRIGGYFFSHRKARDVAKGFYAKLLAAAKEGDFESVPILLRQYGIESGVVWSEVRESMPSDLVD